MASLTESFVENEPFWKPCLWKVEYIRPVQYNYNLTEIVIRLLSLVSETLGTAGGTGGDIPLETNPLTVNPLGSKTTQSYPS